jgi:hypothetical protein
VSVLPRVPLTRPGEHSETIASNVDRATAGLNINSCVVETGGP